MDDDNPPLSFFLPLENKSEWFLRALFLCCCCCLRTDRNFFRETEKILRKKIKKKRNISSNTFCAQTFYNTAVTRAIIKKGGERQNVNVCGGGGI